MTQVAKAQTANGLEPYLSAFEQFERSADRRTPAWLHPIRKAGIAHFSELGFPTTRDEEWRFTNVAPIQRLPFKPLVEPDGSQPSAEQIAKFAFPGLKCSRLVYIDGCYSEQLSELDPRLEEAHAGSLAQAMSADADLLERHLARYARCDASAFTALNTAFFVDGGFVRIPRGVILEEPIHLLFLRTTGDAGATAHPRNLIVAEENSQATVIEHYVSLAEGAYFTNAVTEIVLGENAVLEHCKIQTESEEAFHVATVQARQDRSSNLRTHSISTGARLARNDIHTVLNAEGAQCLMNGLYIVHGAQLVDHHTVIDHAKPHCETHEFYNGVLDGRSHGVFNGKIFVRPDAQKTDAKQTSRALLLSEDATINSKPQLEIFADDVKCTHGSTVGQLNEEAVFYMRSRGIGLEQARRMLIAAFAGEIIDRIKIPAVRSQLERHLVGQLTRRNVSNG